MGHPSATILGTGRHSPLPLAPRGPPGQWLLAERFGSLRLFMSDHCRAEPSCWGAGHGSHGPALLLELRGGGCRTWVCPRLSQARHSWPCQRSDRARDLLTLVLDNSTLACGAILTCPAHFFGDARPTGGSGIFTIVVPVWCQVYVSDPSWARALHLPGRRHVALEIRNSGKSKYLPVAMARSQLRRGRKHPSYGTTSRHSTNFGSSRSFKPNPCAQASACPST